MPRVKFNPIRNVQLPSVREFNEELLGIDLYEKAFDGQWANNDDYQIIAGLGNLRQAIYHRLITNPGELFAHPDYGAGLEEYVSAPINLETRAEITRRIKDQLMKEPRVHKVTKINVRTGDSTTAIGTLIIEIGIIPIGDNAEQLFRFAISELDWMSFNRNDNEVSYTDMAQDAQWEADQAAAKAYRDAQRGN